MLAFGESYGVSAEVLAVGRLASIDKDRREKKRTILYLRRPPAPGSPLPFPEKRCGYGFVVRGYVRCFAVFADLKTIQVRRTIKARRT